MAEVEVWRGSVAAWECDAMGHLNVGFYVARSIEALAGLAAELGMPGVFAPTAEATLIVREQYIRFVREARANAPLMIAGGVMSIGESDARLLLLMRHADGALAAAFQSVVVHATSRDGRPFPWPDRLRKRAAELAVEAPEASLPRSLALDPVTTTASLARAHALGLPRTGVGVVMASDCDAFGRMRTEEFMRRLSSGVPHLFAAGRPGEAASERRVGGAVVEYRLLHHAWPRAGQRLELRSGFSGSDTRVRRLVHWLLDPDSGNPWATAEAISVSFDLDTRKLITLSQDEASRLDEASVKGLGL